MRVSVLMALLVFGTAGFLAGRFAAPTVVARAEAQAIHDPAAPVSEATRRSACVATVDTAALRADLRGIIADEMRKEGAGAGDRPPEAAPKDAPDPGPTDEQVAAADRSETLVATARASHRWSREDARAIRSLLRSATPEQRRKSRQAIALAINNGDIVPDVDAVPPF